MEAGTAIAIGQLSTKVLSIIWKYYSDVKDAKSSITFLANEIQNFSNVLQNFIGLLQRSSKIPVSATLGTTITQALTDIQTLKDKLEPGTGPKAMKRFGNRALKWPLTKKEVDEWVERFERFKATLNLALNRDQTSLILDVDDNINQLKQNQKAIEQDRLLAKLPSAVEASFDSYHRQHQTHCIEDTRVELLQQLQDWGASHDRPIYWLSGMAGTGKSTIARTFAARLKDSKTLGGNFFFSRSSGEANNAVKFVGTLAYHLAKALPVLKESICEAISLHEDVTRQGLRNQWRELIVRPLSKVRLSNRATVNIVVDALDECGSDDDIRLLLQLFVEVKDLTTINLGVFVTSRPDIVIRLGFGKIPEIIHKKRDLRDIPRHLVEHDILVLLKREFGRIRLERNLPEWPSEHDLQSLAQRSDCLFIYAVTVCRYIDNVDWNPKERLSEILDTGHTGGGVTAELDAMYMQVLRSSLSDSRGEEEISRLCHRFKQVVGSIVTLFDELSVSALAELLSLTDESVNAALNRLHSVLNIPDDKESPIRLIHPSFHDFLLDRRRCQNGRFCADEPLMHGELFGKCMKAMTTTLKRNSCHLSTPGSPPQDVDKKSLDTQLPRHVQYACNYWLDHLAGARDSRAQLGLRDGGEVHVFFETSFLHWLEAMSLMGKISHAVLMVTKLASMLKLDNGHSLQALVEDARRFILSNRAVIEKAPLQVYASALVFSPLESLVRKCYQDQQPTWLNRQLTDERRWGNCVQTVETDDEVKSIAFSPNGKYVAAGLGDGTVQLLDAATGASYSILEGHSKRVTKLTFFHDGILASVSDDGTLRLWEPVTGVNRSVLNIDSPYDEHPRVPSRGDFREPVRPSLSVLPIGDLAVLCLDGRLRIWSREKSSLSDSILPDFVTRRLHGCLPQGTLVIESSREDDSAAKFLLFDTNARKFEILEFAQLDRDEWDKVAVSPDNAVALSLSDGRIILYHVVARSFSEFGVHSPAVRALAFSPDGSSLVSVGSDRTMRSWGLKKQAQSLIGSVGNIPDIAVFSPDGKQIVVTTSEYPWRNIQIWDASLRTTEILTESPPAITRFIGLSPCGRYLATTGYDEGEALRIHNTKDASEFVSMAGGDKVLKMTFSADSKRLAFASEDKTIRLWDTSTGVAGVILASELGAVNVLEFSPDGKHLASGNHKGEVRIWSPVTGDLQSVFKHKGAIKRITFSIDGKRIAVVSWSSTDWSFLDVWDTGTQQSLYHTYHASWDTGVAVSHDQKRFAYQSTEDRVIVYNSETKEHLQGSISLFGCRALAFSNNDKLLAFCAGMEIRLWSTETLQCTEIIHTYELFDRLSFTADGTCLETNTGLFQMAQPEVQDVSKSRSAWRCQDEWMMEGTRKMLWLPPDWRNTTYMEHHNGVFVFRRPHSFGCLQFTQGGPIPGIE
ncbi:MAG: hypothetical protein Q9173_002458 [Seirophora scorigena]